MSPPKPTASNIATALPPLRIQELNSFPTRAAGLRFPLMVTLMSRSSSVRTIKIILARELVLARRHLCKACSCICCPVVIINLVVTILDLKIELNRFLSLVLNIFGLLLGGRRLESCSETVERKRYMDHNNSIFLQRILYEFLTAQETTSSLLPIYIRIKSPSTES